MKRIIAAIIMLALALLVFFITREVYRPAASSESVSSTVLLERIRPVLKLITVEGDFSELYNYRNAEAPLDWLKQFQPFQKWAVLRVTGKASVGYDLEGLKLDFNDADHTVSLVSMGKPQLLSLEHDVDYFDLEAGTFTSFTAADHSRINAQAKDLMRKAVEQSGLYKSAEIRRDELLPVLRSMVESAGWTLKTPGMEEVPAKALPQ
ncbi:MAG: DUF4230 domain-containing protein [Flavobacteriales bacterium]|jgi:hypothetical protein|nr:DUF4230 domain-containing protein [Flavobacteriales bacterium]